MPFSPLDFLAAIVAACGTAYFCRLDRLAIEARRTGRGLASRWVPHPDAQCVDHPRPGAIIAPPGKVLVHRALGKQIVGQEFPLAAGSVLIQQCQDLRKSDFEGRQAVAKTVEFAA